MFFLQRSLIVFLFTVLLCQAALPINGTDSTPPDPPPPLLPIPPTPTPSYSTPSSSTSLSSTSSSSAPSSAAFSGVQPASLNEPHSSITSSHSSIPSTSTSILPSPSVTSTTNTVTPHTTSSTTSTSIISVNSTSASSSSTFQSSSSSSSSSSTLVTPQTTLVLQSLTDPTSTGLASASDPAVNSETSTSSPPVTFWKNKAAVAGVFVTAGLACLIFATSAAYMTVRRRQRKLQEMEAEDFFDKGESGEQDTIRGASPIPSITQVTLPVYPESYVSRNVHFGHYMDYASQTAYGLEYPPTSYNVGAPVQEPTYSSRSDVFAAPNQPSKQSIGTESGPSYLPRPSFSNSTSFLGHLNPLVHSEQSPNRAAGRASPDSFYGGPADTSFGRAV